MMHDFDADGITVTGIVHQSVKVGSIDQTALGELAGACYRPLFKISAESGIGCLLENPFECGIITVPAENKIALTADAEVAAQRRRCLQERGTGKAEK